jgi:hypothetical protein
LYINTGAGDYFIGLREIAVYSHAELIGGSDTQDERAFIAYYSGEVVCILTVEHTLNYVSTRIRQSYGGRTLSAYFVFY